MLRLLIAILFISVIQRDCWQPIILNAERNYVIRNEGKLYTPLYSQNEETIKANLVIDADSAIVIKMGNSLPVGDTTVIELFEPTVSHAHLFSIHVLRDKYFIRYSREINFTDLVQKFEPVKTKLELNSSDFSKGSKIRGHVEYTGKCVSGCSDKNKKIRIKGNFVVKIHRY